MSTLPPPRAAPTLETAYDALAAVWGYRQLRTHQRRVIAAVIRGRDCLAVLPTGAGKSLCYQIPSLILSGLTLVVSPLISLMQDQVAAARPRGVRAAYLSSTQRPAVQAAVREAVGRGGVQLLYVAPERLGRMPNDLGARPVSLLAVDEAHCISEWGHDFRPHYREIGDHRARLGNPPTVALTATATPETRADIRRVLNLVRPVEVVTSFDRPNLRFLVRRVRSEPERFAALRSALRGLSGSAIVYVPTRNRADGAAKILRWWGLDAAPYHAGLPPKARKALLGRFLEGNIRVMVATNAFGMGIDKPDVRVVAHLGIPMRPEAYYQEAGRGGRDGLPATCMLLWTAQDLVLARQLGARQASAPAQLRALATMRRYVTTRRCRRRILLEYLGERIATCSGCDRCRSTDGPADRWTVRHGRA